jgi:hypothetical protein
MASLTDLPLIEKARTQAQSCSIPTPNYAIPTLFSAESLDRFWGRTLGRFLAHGLSHRMAQVN